MKNAKKILLVTKPSPDFDTYISLLTLIEVINRDLQKQAELGLSGDIPARFKAALALPEIKHYKVLPPKKFVIEFKNQNHQVNNIQWNQEKDQLKFFITMGQGEFNPAGMSITTTGTDHDLIIAIGVNNLTELGEIYTTSKSIFEERRMIVLAKGAATITGNNVRIVGNKTAASVSEQLFALLNEAGIRVEETRATNLMAGIFSATNNLKKQVTDPATFEVIAKLARSKANNETASALAEKSGKQEEAAPKPTTQAPAATQPAQQPTAQQTAAQPQTMKQAERSTPNANQ